MAESYYDLLGVAPDASTEEIERAYRDRLKQTHPDVSDAADAGERTRRLIRAKEVLTDEDERARYDRLGHRRYVGEPGTPDPEPAGQGQRRDKHACRGGNGTAGRAGARTDDPDGGVDAGSGGTAEAAGRERRQRRRGRREHVGTPGWSGGNGRDGSARAWNPDSPYAVRGEPTGAVTGRGLGLLSVTGVCYPVLVGGALFPGFPAAVNLLVAVCALAVVAYLQSAPRVGVVVFGAWLVLGPLCLVAAGLPLVSVYGAGVVLATALPLGLSALTAAVL